MASERATFIPEDDEPCEGLLAVTDRALIFLPPEDVVALKNVDAGQPLRQNYAECGVGIGKIGLRPLIQVHMPTRRAVYQADQSEMRRLATAVQKALRR